MTHPGTLPPCGNLILPSAAPQLCDSAAPSPRLCKPLLPCRPLPCPRRPRPSSFPSNPLSKHTPPPRMRPEPAHLTLGRGLPAFAAHHPGSVQAPEDTHRLSTGRKGLAGGARRRRRDTNPSGDPQYSSHFVVLCRLPRGPARCGRGLCSPRLRHGLVGGAGRRHFPPLWPPLRALNLGCEASGYEPGGLWSAFWAPSL